MLRGSLKILVEYEKRSKNSSGMNFDARSAPRSGENQGWFSSKIDEKTQFISNK